MVDKLTPCRGDAGLALARATVEELAANTVPTSPANYEVWIAHATGACPDLSLEIRTRLQRGEVFTDEVNEDSPRRQ